MKNRSIALIATVISVFSLDAQQTLIFKDPQEKFKEAKEYYQKEQYSIAYPLFKELQQASKETNYINDALVTQEINYYTTVLALKQNEGRAEETAIDFIALEKNNARVQQMNFHLGEFYYRKQNFPDAAKYYEDAGIANLSNREISDMKFHRNGSLMLAWCICHSNKTTARSNRTVNNIKMVWFFCTQNQIFIFNSC
jgi:tetratricopeptide (TPR) repeat protein